MSGLRQEKLGSLIKREIAIIFQRESNTLFNGRFITVTSVRLSPDLSVAKIYVSIMASKDKNADLKQIESETWKIRKLLAATAGKHLRKMPELHFYLDDSLDYFEDIDRLLKG
ncbi:MAG: 30S ribosome-binding factor RbfA [Cryomorphaceae bacterium]|jgi:ribosome-binding factor A|nr:30S ribosome-binding factor RbfA [Cryomorphaceae bacterium]MDP4827399.1 30S ribosome-binding factor RbfA [Flavobacteriales bacterium]